MNQIHMLFSSRLHTAFSGARDLKRHINLVQGHKDHKCDSCGMVFSIVGNLKKHINTVHNGEKDYKCDTCETAFSGARDLKRHINGVHNG